MPTEQHAPGEGLPPELPGTRSGRCRSWRWVGAVSSGFLLAAAFPPFGVGNLAWVALIPLLLVLMHEGKPGSSGDRPSGLIPLACAFRLGFAGGLVFWLITMSWMLRLFETSPAPAILIVVGWVLLSAYCALYMGFFAMSVVWVGRLVGKEKLWQTALLSWLIPVLWVGGEVVRSYLITGFPWNLLGMSQYRNVVLIQCAQWVGVPGISALVMLGNAGLAFTLLRYLPPRRDTKYRPHLELFMALLTVAICFRLGIGLVRQYAPSEGGVTIAAVQPAIPQVKKWSQEQIDLIHSTFRKLTQQAVVAGVGKPDLVIWPETATPYCVTEEGESRELVAEMSRQGVPLLVGSMDVITIGHEMLCYNGSFLFDTNAAMVAHYYKQHLVPFGEYVPLSGLIPALAALAPMGWNCVPGREATVFKVGAPAWTFSCLICFEDIMADLSRKFVAGGARLLINQTNDAWFDRSAGPEQHMSHCVFRCIENRVPAIRVANSGITCLIQPNGFVVDPTVNAWGHDPEAVTPSWQVSLPDADMDLTVYTRYGDWIFGIPCGIVAVTGFVLAWLKRRE